MASAVYGVARVRTDTCDWGGDWGELMASQQRSIEADLERNVLKVGARERETEREREKEHRESEGTARVRTDLGSGLGGADVWKRAGVDRVVLDRSVLEVR